MPSEVFQIEHLTFRTSGRAILDDISFTTSKNEFITVIGPNGAGKSTLLKHLIGLATPPPGTIKLFGKCLTRWKHKDIAAKVAYVPQNAPTYLPFTARQFVLMGRYPHINPLLRPDIMASQPALDALERVGMSHFADRPLEKMSGGECQRVFIAAALAQQPEILLLDEPTTFLDPSHQCGILSILTTLNATTGVSILAVSHDLNFACAAGGRVIALRDGRIFYDGPTTDFISSQLPDTVFDTPFDYIATADGRRYIFPSKGMK